MSLVTDVDVNVNTYNEYVSVTESPLTSAESKSSVDINVACPWLWDTCTVEFRVSYTSIGMLASSTSVSQAAAEWNNSNDYPVSFKLEFPTNDPVNAFVSRNAPVYSTTISNRARSEINGSMKLNFYCPGIAAFNAAFDAAAISMLYEANITLSFTRNASIRMVA